MDINVLTDLLIVLCLVFLTYYTFTNVTLIKKALETPSVSVELPDLSPEEIQRIERKKAYDKRINSIKDELRTVRTGGNTAEELHPLVKNLPHEIIDKRYNTLPDVEVIRE